MEKGREGRDSGSEVWGVGREETAKEVVVTSMGLGEGGRRSLRMKLGGKLVRERDRSEGCIRLQDRHEQC